MKILFVDNDHQHARDLYTQFLSYRGTSWNVVHATTLAEAQEWLAYDHFDVVLTALPSSGIDQDFYAQFVDRAAAELPVVVLLFESDDSEFVEWVNRGACDCLNGQVANGDYIMRRLRMAISRFHYQAKRREHNQSAYCKARSIAAEHATVAGSCRPGKRQAHHGRCSPPNAVGRRHRVRFRTATRIRSLAVQRRGNGPRSCHRVAGE